METTRGLITAIKRRPKKIGWNTVDEALITVRTKEGWTTLRFSGADIPAILRLVTNQAYVFDYRTDGRGNIIQLRGITQVTGPGSGEEIASLSHMAQTTPVIETSTFQPPEIPALNRLTSTLTDPTAKGIVDRVIKEPKFYETPAAEYYHHAYRGGLLRHSIGVAEEGLRLADQLGVSPLHFNLPPHEQEVFKRATATLPKGTPVSRDIIIAGALVHDIGKMREYNIEADGTITRTTNANLYHTASGQEMVLEWARTIPNVDEHTVNILTNVVASHHVKAEYQSLDARRSPEALLLSMADGYDSNQSREAGYLHQEYLQTLAHLARDTYRAPDLVILAKEQAKEVFQEKLQKLQNKPGGDLETATQRANRLKKLRR